ncbi:MAG: histidine phosphatase family protein [Firmicutes bacterium]|nr:histidine phosphatase family protein [Bacillota bacterium]
MDNKLYVVHHSKGLEAPALPSSLLPLSREGVLLTTPVAEASFWNSVAAIYSSPELRAVQTAEIIAKRWQLPLYLVDDLRDMWLTSAGLEPDHLVDIVGDHLEGKVSHQLLEPYDAAQERIVRCVQRLARENTDRNFAIVSHARILIPFYSHLFGRRLGRNEWLSIRSPDLSVINHHTWQVTAGFFSEFK